MSETRMQRGEVIVRVVGTDEQPLIELEFWPPDSRPIGFRLPPESALRIAHDLTEALASLGLVEAVPPWEERN